MLQKRMVTAAALVMTVVACAPEQQTYRGEADPLLETLAPAAGATASAKFISPDGEFLGNVTMSDSTNGVLIRVDLKNLPQGWHGIHLHQIGDCGDGSEGFKASGGHINPDGNAHGLLNPDGYERADMPNIYAGADGRATAAFFNSYVRLNNSEDVAETVGFGAVLLDTNGFAMVVHENADDHQSQPIGGAGPRIACAAFN
ncbi:superoxide dismutase family protein [Parvularcula sp. IMCC14364]|uniref:superoxide dismutase family protein n=1 Tax=Parvularcula sp. IMCC14364 TaxID=3067902 RepID=UPI0027403775|nr:superoxide dismutase family protein [Parvularcula sp. IMCC14364]